MIYSDRGLYIDSDFQIRILRQEGNDVDLFIPIGNRTINLYFDDEINTINSRLQFSIVRNLIFRLSTNIDNNILTVHMLNNIDLHSSVVNFEIDYSGRIIEVKDKEYFVEMRIKKIKSC